jgi:hypothetical protein
MMREVTSESDMRSIYLRSLIAVVGIVLFVLIELLAPNGAGAFHAAPSGGSGAELHDLR